MSLEHHVLFPGQVAIDDGLLALDADDLSNLLRLPVHVVACHGYRPRRLLQERREHLDRSALSGAVRPKETEEFTFTYLERDAVDRFGPVAVYFDEIVDGDHVGHETRRWSK